MNSVRQLDRQKIVGFVEAARLDNFSKHRREKLLLNASFIREQYGPKIEKIVEETKLGSAFIEIANGLARGENVLVPGGVNVGKVLGEALSDWTKHKAVSESHQDQKVYFDFDGGVYVLKYHLTHEGQMQSFGNARDTPFVLSINRKEGDRTAELISNYDSRTPQNNSTPLLALYYVATLLTIGGNGMQTAIDRIKNLLLSDQGAAQKRDEAGGSATNDNDKAGDWFG